MKKILFILCLLALPSSLLAQKRLKVANAGEQPIYFSYVYRSVTGNFFGFTSVGWFKTIPEQVIEIEIPENDGYLYYFAQYENGKSIFTVQTNYPDPTENLYQFAVATQTFKIQNADKDYVFVQNPSYVKYSFKRMQLLNGSGVINIY